MTEHTPGPWSIEVLEELTLSGERRPASYISSSQGWANSGMAGKRTIAIVGHWRDRPNPEADARLIAKAPKLLEACRHAVDYHRPYVDESGVVCITLQSYAMIKRLVLDLNE